MFFCEGFVDELGFIYVEETAKSNLRNFKLHTIYRPRERRVIGIFGSLIWSKTLIELIFNLCGEFQ